MKMILIALVTWIIGMILAFARQDYLDKKDDK